MRWTVNLNWPIIKDRITIFPNHEGYPSLENSKDLYIMANTSAVFHIYKNFIIKPQVTYRDNNNPPVSTPQLPVGTTKHDAIDLITFGYSR